MPAMHRCLGILEIIRAICNELDNKDSLAMALVNRTFLEPALDRIWNDIRSFDPLAASLPADLLTRKQVYTVYGTSSTIISLQRAIRHSDIERYLNYYASRIHSFAPDVAGISRISVEALQALQAVTESQPGALAPHLKSFSFVTPETSQGSVTQSFFDSLYPCISLFLGPEVETAHFDIWPGHPFYPTVVQASLKHLHRLKKLTLSTANGTPSLDYYLEELTVPRLEKLVLSKLKGGPPENMGSVTGVTMPLLSGLPHLAHLELADLRDIPYRYLPRDVDAIPDSVLPISGFPSLKVLRLTTSQLPSATAFLQHIQPHTALKELCIDKVVGTASAGDVQDAIAVINLHVDSRALKRLTLTDPASQSQPLVKPESLEITPEDAVDVTPLLQFKHLQDLEVSTRAHVRVTPEVVKGISTSMRDLTTLHLCSPFPTSRLPLIDHTHFLEILEGCPLLRDLSLYFDATRVVGKEVSPRAPFHLHRLAVGDSPIYSSKRVASFLKANVPHIDGVRTLEIRDEIMPEVYRTRWNDVDRWAVSPWAIRRNVPDVA